MFKEQEISFNTAVLAKQKGFEQKHIEEHYLKDENLDTSNMAWQNGLSLGSAPSQSILQKWLREEQDTDILIHKVNNNYHYQFTYQKGKVQSSNKTYGTYEHALEESLFKALTLI